MHNTRRFSQLVLSATILWIGDTGPIANVSAAIPRVPSLLSPRSEQGVRHKQCIDADILGQERREEIAAICILRAADFAMMQDVGLGQRRRGDRLGNHVSVAYATVLLSTLHPRRKEGERDPQMQALGVMWGGGCVRERTSRQQTGSRYCASSWRGRGKGPQEGLAPDLVGFRVDAPKPGSSCFHLQA